MHPDVKQVAAFLFFLVIGSIVVWVWTKRARVQKDFLAILGELEKVKTQQQLTECHLLIRIFTLEYKTFLNYDNLEQYTNALWEEYNKKFRTVYPEPQEFTV